jgi:hypothetical protein
MIYGLIRLKKFFKLFLFYLIAAFGILLLWPEVWVGTRFVLPLIPLLSFLFINGAVELISLLGFRVLKIKSQNAIYLTLVALSLLSMNSYGKGALKTLKFDAKGRFGNNYQNYFKLAEWIKKNASPTSVTCCRKGALFYLYSGKYVTGFENTNNVEEEIKYLEKVGTNYVILDHLGYSSTALYLFPAIKKYPNKFKEIVHLKNPDTYLLQFYPHVGYWGQWKNNMRNGFGTFQWVNGMKYEGNWKNNLRSGKGTLFNPNGERLEGVWKNDKLNGMAVLKLPDGKIKEWILYKDNHAVKVYQKTKPQ